MLKNLLTYRFAIFNAIMFGLLGLAMVKGWGGVVLAADVTYLSVAIAIIFTIVWASSAKNALRTSSDLDAVKRGWYLPMDAKVRRERIEHIREASNWLAYLGLIGTVVGFIMAFGVADVTSAASVEGVRSLVPQLMRGMDVAMYTTLVGAIASLWTQVNYRMIKTATEYLISHNSGHE